MLVYVGGGRPKGHDENLGQMEEMKKNGNLIQWLGKRGMQLNTFKSLIDGNLPPKPQKPLLSSPPNLLTSGQGQSSSSIMSTSSGYESGFNFSKEASPLVRNDNVKKNQNTLWTYPNNFGQSSSSSSSTFVPELDRFSGDLNRSVRNVSEEPPQTVRLDSDFANPIMAQAKNLLSRVMSCTSPEDIPMVRQVVR